MSKPLTISSDTQMPPGGWKYRVEETGATITANYANSLHGRVNSHLMANSLPVVGRAEFEDKACRDSGHGAPWCTGVVNPKPPTTMHRIRSFLKAAKVVARRRDFVSPEEHERRMAICRKCPLNSEEGLGCHGCVEDLRAVERDVGTMPSGIVLTCRACGCVCWIKAWLPNEAMDEAEAKEPVTYAPGCWRLGL